MYIFQIENGNKVVRQELEMEKFNNKYVPVDKSAHFALLFSTNEPTEEQLDTLIPFGNDKYIMFSKNGDVLRYIDKVTECRKKELEYRKIQVQNLENRIQENNFEVLIVEE